MHLYFVRHGQSENNLLYAQTGGSEGRVADPALTAKGHEQAALVARFLARTGGAESWGDGDSQNVNDVKVTHCYTSLMERAVATGHTIAEALDLPLLGWIDLHETGGMFQDDKATGMRVPQPGRSRSYLQATYPRIVLPEGASEDGWWNRPFELHEARTPRAQRVLVELLERHGDTDDGVILVSHGGFFNHFMRVVLSLPDTESVWFAARNTSVTHLRLQEDDQDGNRVLLLYLNRVDFLPGDLLS